VGVVGPDLDLTYPATHLGAGPRTLAEIAAGTHAFAETLDKAKNPMLILGQGALARADGAAVLALAREIAEKFAMVRVGGDDAWNGFNLLHTAAARVGGLDLGFVPGDGGRDTDAILDAAADGGIEVVWLLGADEIDMTRLGGAFVIYQGHHGDAGAHRADVILPGAAYTEKDATYVNTEGRVQRGQLAVFPPGEARADWKIPRALSERLGHTLPYDTLEAVRARLAEVNPVFAEIDGVVAAEWGAFGAAGETGEQPFAPPIANYYMTDPIGRASVTMAKCGESRGLAGNGRTGTDG